MEKNKREITYCQALNEATIQEMEKDPTVFVYCIGVPDHKKIFGSTEGILEKFGKDRCFDTPLSEDAMTGAAIGMAFAGLRPIHIHIRVTSAPHSYSTISIFESLFVLKI